MNNLVQLNPVNLVEQKLAIEADHAHEKVSPKYKFINTSDIVDKFISRGWIEIGYREAFTRKYKGYQTHIVTLTHRDEALTTVGDSSLRILICNNHHAGKALTIKFGLYRLVCSNGLVVNDAQFEGINIRHMGEDIDEKVNTFIDKISVAAEKMREKIELYKNKTMTIDEVREFATKALATRFKPEVITSDMVDAVARANRPEDTVLNVWNVFNRVQENLIRGFESADRDRRIRRITSVKKDMEINEQLWSLLAA